MGVQLIGREAIIDTYNECGSDTFALFQGKSLVVADSGADKLGVWIDRFCPAGMSGAFTLRLYDCPADEVRQGTEYTASFPCRVVDGYSSIGGFTSSHAKRLEALEKKLDGGDKEDRFTDALYGLIEEPEKLLQVVGAVKAMFGGGVPQVAQTAIGAITPKTIPAGELTEGEEQRYRRLCKALDRIEKKDPNIVDHLEKLADIAETKPDTFNGLVGMLGNM